MADAGARGLLVGLGDRLVLLPIEVVQEVIEIPRVTRLPSPAPHLAGLIALRGRVLPLWHAAGLLGLSGAADPTTCVRLMVEGVGLALLVDRVDGLRQVSGSVGAGVDWWSLGTVLLPVGAEGAEDRVGILDTGALLARAAA